MIVLDTTRPVVDAARLVRIDDAAILRWAAGVRPDDLRPRGHDLLAELPGDRPTLANLVLLIDSLNFCFWGDPPPTLEWRGRRYAGFNALLAAVIRAAQQDARWADPRFWAAMTRDDFRAALASAGPLPLMDERERVLRETGRTLTERFAGGFAEAADSVNRRAWDLAALLAAGFGSFRDVSAYRGRAVWFVKRAQIAALDLSTTWSIHGHEPLAGLERLTAFADYRLPQALQHLGILLYAPPLAAAIDGLEELPPGGEAEVEIRAATVWAVERMRVAAAARGIDSTAWEIDWHLWDRAHAPDVTRPHHRTRTIYY
jgi:hypothetical protein